MFKVCAPKDIGTLWNDTSIQKVTLGCFCEWGATHDHLEKNDGEGEDVNLSSIIGCSKIYLGSHVSGCTELGSEEATVIFACYVGRETKVEYLWNTAILYHDVVWLDVTMDSTAFMDML